MDSTIEILNKADLNVYKKLIDECFGFSNDIEKYEKYHRNANYKVWVAKDNEAIVGSVTQYNIDLFTFDFQPCIMLFNVAVKKEYRKQGIAKRLLEFIIEAAKAEGYLSISLNCLDKAYAAHQLYESLGFEKAGSIKYELNLRS